MLVKLARYLRCLGYDAACDPALALPERLLRAEREGRILLTRNRRILHQQRAPRLLCVVEESDPVLQLAAVSARFGLEPSAHAFTRCIRCNLALHEVAKDETVRAQVESGVWERYEHFFRCPGCATLFWRGSHVRNTCAKLDVPDASEG